MLRLLVFLMLSVLAIMGAVTFALMGLPRLAGDEQVIQYGQYAPRNTFFFHYVDMDHDLDVSLRKPAQVIAYSSTSISPRSGQRVRVTQDGKSAELFIVEEDGTQRQIAHLSHFTALRGIRERIIFILSWSPDGSWIMFLSMIPGGASELYMVRPDGSHLYRYSRIVQRGDGFTPRWVVIR